MSNKIVKTLKLSVVDFLTLLICASFLASINNIETMSFWIWDECGEGYKRKDHKLNVILFIYLLNGYLLEDWGGIQSEEFVNVGGFIKSDITIFKIKEMID